MANRLSLRHFIIQRLYIAMFQRLQTRLREDRIDQVLWNLKRIVVFLHP
jgi:hypothetical protein